VITKQPLGTRVALIFLLPKTAPELVRPTMKPVIVFIRHHPVLTYFVLVFVISWGGGFLILGPGGLPLRPEEFDNLPALLYVAMLGGPSVAGMLLTGLVDGRRGFGDLLTRLGRWQAGWWYVLALVPALVTVATAALLSRVSAEFRPALFDSNDIAGVVTSALAPSIVVGIFEEIGWTGFAVPHLRSRHSVLSTGLAVGVVWGAWHFPLFWESDSFSGGLPLTILLTRLFSWLPAFRVLLVWIHDRTQSLPVVMFMHAVVTFISIVLAPETLIGAGLLTSLLVSAVTMWLLLAAVAVAAGGVLSGKPLSRQAA
jgi:membrane protease YdiL (CAAX protease family)